ncbi:MAG: ABC transporter permease, partial [Deltaproteobacteria bacterium]|nr:ABC transporter permease [Deltaproteobacteria bacterium]
MVDMVSKSSAMTPNGSTLVTRLRQNWDRAVVPAIFLAMLIVFYALDTKYLSTANVINVLNQVSILAIVTVGASIVIFTGGFDLSAGSVVAISAVIGAIVVEQTGNLALAISTGVLTGAVAGSVNGFFVGYLGVSPLIVTLGSLNIGRGLALIITAGSAIYSFPASYTDFGISRTLGIPTLAVVAFAAFLVMA